MEMEIIKIKVCRLDGFTKGGVVMEKPHCINTKDEPLKIPSQKTPTETDRVTDIDISVFSGIEKLLNQSFDDTRRYKPFPMFLRHRISGLKVFAWVLKKRFKRMLEWRKKR